MKKRIEISQTTLRIQIEKRLRELKSLRESLLVSETETLPGKLHVINKGNHVEFYLRDSPDETPGIYLGKDKAKLIKRLVEKKYVDKVLNEIGKEIKTLSKTLKNLPVDSHIEEIYGRLTDVERKMIAPIGLPMSLFIEEWSKEEYEGLEFREGASELFTDKGERVRSKSEIMIANALYKHKIPYYYEKPYRLKNGILVHPDFTALNVRTRETMYWEHLGMMDDIEYNRKAISKIHEYKESGLYPGRGLILTSETSRHPLNTKEIEKTIEVYLK